MTEVEATVYRIRLQRNPAPACAGAARETYAHQAMGKVRLGAALGRLGRFDSDSSRYRRGSSGGVFAMA